MRYINIKNFIKLYAFIYRIIFRFSYKILENNIFISPLASISNKKNISIGRNSRIHRGCVIWCKSIELGENVHINPNTVIYGRIKIGNDVMIAPNCTIVGGNHSIKLNGTPMYYQPTYGNGIIIEDDVWIGSNVIL
jgi:acetyltransferase-like isoleucine patch superfamily enzyme